MTHLTEKQILENDRRAFNGFWVLLQYKEFKARTDDEETILVDLLADIMHHAQDQNIDVDSILSTARTHFDAELEGDE